MEFSELAQCSIDIARNMKSSGSLEPMALGVAVGGGLVPMLALGDGPAAVNRLVAGLQQQARSGEVMAGALIYDAYLRDAQTGAPSGSGVVIHVEDGRGALRGVIPYEETAGGCAFGAPEWRDVPPLAFSGDIAAARC